MTEISHGRPRLDWIQTAIRLAFNIAEYRSQDPDTQVGACLIKNDGGILLGYNGGPPGIEINWDNREEKRAQVLHAEENILDTVFPEDIKILALTHIPCPRCIRNIRKKKIKDVYYVLEPEHFDVEGAKKLADLFNINLIQLPDPR
jgi:dCMP deaminase